jgi:hypothetical protein
MMSRQATGREQLFYTFSMEDHVPQEHLLRGIHHLIGHFNNCPLWPIMHSRRLCEVVGRNARRRLIGGDQREFNLHIITVSSGSRSASRAPGSAGF